MAYLPAYVRQLLDDIAAAEGFRNYKTELKSGSNNTDGFMGIMTSVVISGEQKSENGKTETKQLHLLCKLVPDNEQRRKEFSSDEIFAREALMYNKILPLITGFQREKGLTDDECFLSYAKCYAAIADAESDQYVVIMEDLRPRGFAMWPKRQPTAVNHCTRIIEELAKMHSVSFALKDQRPHIYDELRKITDLWAPQMARNGMLNMMNVSFDKAIDVLEREEHIQIAKEMKANVQDILDLYLGGGAWEPFGAVIHGDCWINNHMFRYKNGKISELAEICVLDWQYSRFGALITDLCDVLVSTSDKEFRDKNLTNLIKYYYERLSAAIKRLGSDPDQLFTFDDMWSLFKKYGKYPFIAGLLTIVFALPADKDIPDVNELSENAPNGDDHPNAVIRFDDATEQLLTVRINDLFKDLTDLGFY